VKSILTKALNRSAAAPAERSNARPPAAVELSSQGAVAAVGAPPTYGHAALAAGALKPGVAEANILAPEAVAAALRQALDAVNPPKRAVTLVVPDMAVRVFVLDFDTLPTKSAEALSILRFRLRKTVPFDVEHASIGYQVLTRSRSDCRVLAAVIPGPVLAEYEAAVRSAGYEPGAVIPATLAALENLSSDEPVLLANLSPETLTMTIVQGDDLQLYRILELPEDDALRVIDIQRGVAVAMAYFEDKTGAPPTRIYSTGTLTAEAFAQLLGLPELEVLELVERPLTGAATSLGSAPLAAACGALKGAGQ
jgi:type IV pilus assembly protein PilM